jgi:CheY-like chemotaxis protein
VAAAGDMIFTTGKEEAQRRRSVDLSGIHILIVEDMADSRDVLRMIFELYGARVRTAESAEEGKRLLNEERPDVLVSDIAMPDDGIELIRAVKALADAQDLRIPVIAITAHRYRGDELLAEGFAELVEKPFDPITLCRVVLRHSQPAHA